jgi:phenylalanyl-tRNA synthetase beta chain
MPTIDIEISEFEKLLGMEFKEDIERLDDVLAFVKSEVKLYDKSLGIASIEIKDTNRPDLWSVEGLARGLRPYIGLESGPRSYEAEKSTVKVLVDSNLLNIRPFIGCSLVKGVTLTDAAIRGIMHLQDKLDRTYGRSRQKTSIGIYNFDLISPPLSYSVSSPKDLEFIPLGFSKKMSLEKILEIHPKGQEYGHIVKKHDVYPILIDSNQNVLSFPPIINSNDLGRVTEETHNLLIEVTGTINQTVLSTLTLVTTALLDRGGKCYSTTVEYPDNGYDLRKVVTPDFDLKGESLNVEYVNHILGLQLNSGEIANLLLKAGLGGKAFGPDKVEVSIPCYRVDIMHPIDIVEDVAVAYGYNNIQPLWRDLPTTGFARKEQQLIDIARELMIGAGYQEILNYTLTNPESLFSKMNVKYGESDKTKVVEISNPKLVTMSCLRNWLLPSIMQFLSINKSVEFPQRIFELGKVTLPDPSKETKTIDEEKLACATSHPTSSFSEIKACLDAFLLNLGLPWEVKTLDHPSFIDGRCGAVVIDEVAVGLIGEVSPLVLEAWQLENPVSAFEINMQPILMLKNRI